VNTFSKSANTARTEKGYDRGFGRHAGLFLVFWCRAFAVARITLVLVIVVACNALTTIAQSETSPKPATTVARPAAEKSGSKETLSPPITGSIRGKVTASDGQPILNANIIIQSLSGAPVAKPGRPDAEGHFVFDDLAPGAYIVMAMAPGYIDESMALGNPLGWPRHLIGSSVNISMIRGGVITGSVTNPKGEPIVGVPVRANLTGSQATPTLAFMNGGGSSETDDRGVYRIYGLLPGQYTVQAGGQGAFGQFGASGFDIDVPTFYPSSTRDTAVPVSVRSGDESSGIDIKYKAVDGHSISGVVLGNIDAKAGSGVVTIMLAHATTASVLSVTIAGVADPRRAFSFNGIANGDYDVFASYLIDPNENALIGTKRISVRDGDLTGLELSLAPLGSIAGTITMDPIKPEAKCDKRGSQVIETILKLPPDDPKKVANAMTALFSGLGRMTDSGEFALRNLEAGRYRLDIKLPSESWYVRAINLPARAVQTTPTSSSAQPSSPDKGAQPPATNPNAVGWQGTVTIRSGDSLSGVSILVGQDAAGLRGRAAPEGAVIREGTHVHLVPVERENANNVLRYSETFVKRDGTFAITNVAPGRYFIFSRVEPANESDAAPRPIAWNTAERVKLRREAEAAKTEVELKPCQSMVDYQLK
jgi:hypothetical protein